MNSIIIEQIPSGPFAVNTYILACPETMKGAVIDPAGEDEAILERIGEMGINILFILNTHGHSDHIMANNSFKNALSCPVCLHEKDAEFFQDPGVCRMVERELGVFCPAEPDILLHEGQVLEIGKFLVKTLHTPGHTPGSVCFLAENNLFTGDTLFVEGAGRTDLPGGSLDELISSIEKQILPLPKETRIWPGHDYGTSPTSTLEREMEENPYITDFLM